MKTPDDLGAALASKLIGALRMSRAPGVVSWAESTLRLPQRTSPNEMGRFSTLARPYQREPMEVFHPESGINDVVLCWGSQTAKTTVFHIGGLYRVVNAPGPILWVGPTEPFVRSWSRRTHLSMLEENDVFEPLMPADSDLVTLLEQHFDGSTWTLVGSNSAANLASRPVQIVVCDETGKFAGGLKDEASPSRLADQRTKTFGVTALRAKCSTPTSVDHEFWMDFDAGDQRYFWVPCPHCKEWFVFEHKELGADTDPLETARLASHDDEARAYTLSWDKHAKTSDGQWDRERVKATAHYVCPHCRGPIHDRHKPGMLVQAEWKASREGAPKSYRSYHLNSFYSPDVTFGKMAEEFLKGRDLFGLQDYYNGWLALPWQEMSVNLRDEKLLDLRDMSYRKGECPTRGQLIIAADPGQNQTHWVAALHLDGGELLVVDWGTVLAIEDLREVMARTWPIQNSSRRLAASYGVIDSGDFTQRVYDFCRFTNGWWLPTKGTDAGSGSWSHSQVRSHPGLSLMTYVDYVAKTELYEYRIHRKAPPPIRFPGNVTHEFLSGLSGQQKLERRTPRGVMRFWKRLPNDHYGDALKIAMVSTWPTRNLAPTAD